MDSRCLSNATTNTGLMWEKKRDDGSIHDKATVYTWDNAFAVHIAGLNAAAASPGTPTGGFPILRSW
jgi:hypothetical protein